MNFLGVRFLFSLVVGGLFRQDVFIRLVENGVFAFIRFDIRERERELERIVQICRCPIESTAMRHVQY